MRTWCQRAAPNGRGGSSRAASTALVRRTAAREGLEVVPRVCGHSAAIQPPGRHRRQKWYVCSSFRHLTSSGIPHRRPADRPMPPPTPATHAGAGKSTLLDAIAFAAGCTPGVLGVRQLQELQSTVPGAALPEVELTVAASPTQAHTVHACLTPDGGRAYRIDGRARTAQQLKVGRRPVKQNATHPKGATNRPASCLDGTHLLSRLPSACCLLAGLSPRQGHPH